jgi:hypothetical protein
LVKHKVSLFISILVITLAIMAISCAPAAAPAKPAEQPKPAAAAPVTPPAKPAEKPADTAPAATAGPSIKTSFESATYTDSANGFSFQYPKAWVKDVTVTTEVANYGKTTNVLADHVTAFVNPEAKDLPADFKASWENVPGMKQYNAIIKIESSKATKLADGKTDGMEMVGTCTISGTYEMWTYAISFNKGGKTIIVTTYTFGEPSDMLKEIVKTTVAN